MPRELVYPAAFLCNCHIITSLQPPVDYIISYLPLNHSGPQSPHFKNEKGQQSDRYSSQIL